MDNWIEMPGDSCFGFNNTEKAYYAISRYSWHNCGGL